MVLVRHLLKPNQMNNSWSSRQLLNKKDQRVLSLVLTRMGMHMKLENTLVNMQDIMMTMLSMSIPTTTIMNILESTLINQESE